MKTLLIIGHHIPEPTTTAAGTRMLHLIGLFQRQGFEITFATTASVSLKSVLLEPLDVLLVPIELNKPSFDAFVNKLQPEVVLFDRFVTQEQFGWRVTEICPNALTILDTEDLHFLRKARQEAIKKEIPVTEAQVFTETAKREIASILRCDIALLISLVEVALLRDTFNIDEQLLCYLPLFANSLSEEEKNVLPKFEERDGFMTIGNFLHAPNVDSVRQLKNDIWPKIRQQLPKATLSIYGNYAPQQIQEMHNPKEGFLIKGWVSNAEEPFISAKVCLAPLRFGAGIKGKVIDALTFGTPVITTKIGAEGIISEIETKTETDCESSGENDVPIAIADTTADFVKKAISFYTSKLLWETKQEKGFVLVKEKFSETDFEKLFQLFINDRLQNLNTHREQNFIGEILKQQQFQATKYLSKWIEGKASQ
ncbi:glycosyltransferase [Patiriisocius sp. Uisw_017]|jgi:hypothetical protein|uniref:glycosyltransferase n=1 Tax=Patiriisocius sp. Uisw_017 TaxID=3230968 RepID=UPI0039E84C90